MQAIQNDAKLRNRSPDERPTYQRVYARLPALCGARYPGPPAPHVAISREERDLAYAGHEVRLLTAYVGHVDCRLSFNSVLRVAPDRPAVR